MIQKILAILKKKIIVYNINSGEVVAILGKEYGYKIINESNN